MNKLIEMIEKAQTVAILGHTKPDGDCVGSCLGLYNYISDNYPDKEVVVYLEELPKSFGFLSGSEKVVHEFEDKIYDIAVSLDCSDTDRHVHFGPIFKKAKTTACVDHHKSNEGFGEFFLCEPDASSACEVLYRLLDDTKISRNCAEALYLGIVHDTGVFKYQSTSPETMRIAGALISKGLDTQKIIDDTFYKVSYNQNLLTGHALLHSKLFLDGKLIMTKLDVEDFEKFGAGKDDTEGIVDKIRVTEGTEVAVFAYRLPGKDYKFSLRSIRQVDVSLIALHFSGGGHIRAAGFNAKDFDSAFETILKMVEEQL